MAITKEQKIAALSEFIEIRAGGRVDGHSAHCGSSCKGHDPAFENLATELLALIEDENYGHAPLLIQARSIQNAVGQDIRDIKAIILQFTPPQYISWTKLEKYHWITLLKYDNGSTAIEINSPEDFELRQIELAREVRRNLTQA